MGDDIGPCLVPTGQFGVDTVVLEVAADYPSSGKFAFISGCISLYE